MESHESRLHPEAELTAHLLHVQGIVLDKNTHLIETVRSVSILQSRSCMAAASSQPTPPARNKSDTWRVRAAQLQVTTPQHPPGWRSRFARISGPRPGSCGCPICNLVLTVSMSAELLGTPHASGKKKRKSSSSPQTDCQQLHTRTHTHARTRTHTSSTHAPPPPPRHQAHWRGCPTALLRFSCWGRRSALRPGGCFW